MAEKFVAFFIAACCISLHPLLIFADDNDVSIHIRELGTGSSLSKVEVTLGNTSLQSDAKGLVHIQRPKEDEILTFHKNGFTNLDIPFGALESTDDGCQVFLEPKLVDGDVVTVIGEKRPTIATKVLNQDEIKKTAPGGDPVMVATLLPGVQSGGFDKRLIIRGSGPDDSVYLIDQLVLPFIFHPIGNTSIIPDSLIDDITFSSGNFGGQYGNATGGVLVVNTKSMIPKKSEYEVKLNVPMYFSAFAQTPIDDSSAVSAYIRYSTIQYILPSVLKSLEKKNYSDSLTVIPYFGDAHAQYLSLSDEGKEKTTFLSSFDGLKAAFPSDFSSSEDGQSSVDFRTSFYSLSHNRQKRLTKDWTYNTTPNFLRTKDQTQFLGNRVNVESNSINIPYELSYRRSKREKDYLGAEISQSRTFIDVTVPKFQRDAVFPDFEDGQTESRQISVDATVLSTWYSGSFVLGDFDVEPGLRLDYNNFMQKSSLDPRTNFRYHLNEDATLKAAAGIYSKRPEYDELDKTFGNPELGYEHSIHYAAGIENKWGTLWTSDLQIFRKDFYDTVRTDSQGSLQNSGSGQSHGFEVFLRRNQTSRLFGWVSYTYAVSKERDTKDGYYIPSNYDRRHMFVMAGDYTFTSTLSLSGNLNYQTGAPYTPVADVYYNANIDRYQPQIDASKRNSERLGPSMLLSSYLNQKLLADTWTLNLRYGFENAALIRSPRSVSYNYDYSEKRGVSDLPFIPFIELGAVF